MDENGKVQGTFGKAVQIAASLLNLTLVFQEAKLENRNIWSKRYLVVWSLFKSACYMQMTVKTP